MKLHRSVKGQYLTDCLPATPACLCMLPPACFQHILSCFVHGMSPLMFPNCIG